MAEPPYVSTEAAVMPYSLEAEQTILGAVLTDSTMLSTVL